MKIELKTKNMGELITILGKDDAINCNNYISDDDELIRGNCRTFKKGI